MKIVKDWNEFDRKNKTLWVLSVLGMLVTGGLAVYFVMKAVPEESYRLMAASYLSFMAMLVFRVIPVGKPK